MAGLLAKRESVKSTTLNWSSHCASLAGDARIIFTSISQIFSALLLLLFILLPCTFSECAVFVMEDYVVVLGVTILGIYSLASYFSSISVGQFLCILLV